MSKPETGNVPDDDAVIVLQLRRHVDVTMYKCAICLCDQAWLDPDLDLSNGIALKSQSDMLRLDAMVMTVQLNIRKLLEASNPPPLGVHWNCSATPTDDFGGSKFPLGSHPPLPSTPQNWQSNMLKLDAMVMTVRGMKHPRSPCKPTFSLLSHLMKQQKAVERYL